MYFGGNDELNKYYRIDIEESDIGNTIKLNKMEMDNKSVKNIADYLRSRIPVPMYRFNRGILISGEEKLEISFTDGMFKDSYENVRLIYWKRPYEDMKYRLKEGYRYLSIEECHHMIGLISPNSHKRTIVSIWVDLNPEIDMLMLKCRED